MTRGRRALRFSAGARVIARRLLARTRAWLLTDPGGTGGDAAEVAGAREMARAAAELKGGLAKVAQLAGYLEGPGAVAELEARAALGALWDGVPPVAADEVRRVVAAELGAPPEEIFARWEPVPFAAASLGQVHGATGRDGVEYAVKVQFPGVAEALRDDLASAGLLRRLAGAGLGRALSEATVLALRDAVLAETDYRAEAAALARVRSALAGEEGMIVPRAFPGLSTARVLTMERIRGRTLPEVAAAGDEALRARVGRLVFRFAWGTPLRHGLLNADPNPGNYLVADGAHGADGAGGAGGAARVAFLDFGCTREVTPAVAASDRRVWAALLEPDIAGAAESFRVALHEEGLIAGARAFNGDTYRTWERYLAGPFLVEGGFTWTPAYARGLTEATSQLVRAGVLHLDATTLLLWRQRLGAAAVLGLLRPAADFRRELARLVEVRRGPRGVP